MEGEVDRLPVCLVRLISEQLDQRYRALDGAGAPGGPPKARSGAGSAGRGAARRRLGLIRPRFGSAAGYGVTRQ
jgi:hypothetical protein